MTIHDDALILNLQELVRHNTTISHDARTTVSNAAKVLSARDSRVKELETALLSTLECLIYWCLKAGIDVDNATPDSAIGVARAALRIDEDWKPSEPDECRSLSPSSHDGNKP